MKKLSYDRIFEVCFLFFITVFLNSDFRNNGILWSFSIFLLFLGFLISCRGKIKIHVSLYKIWWCIFLIISILSAFIGIDTNYTISLINAILVIIFIFTLIEEKIKSPRMIKKILFLYEIGIFFMMGYLYLNFDLRKFQLAQFGLETTGNWNGNDVALKIAVGISILLYLRDVTRKKFFKIGAVIAILISFYFIVMTGSRKGIIMSSLTIVLYYILKTPKRTIKNILMSIFILCFIYILIMKNSILYEIIGWRIEGMLALITSNSQNMDSSANIRMMYIKIGIDAFKKSPLLGYGVGNYHLINIINTGHDTYSHNNFIELLVGTGIIGFVAYYWIYFYLIYKFLKKLNIKKINLLSNVVFSNFILLFIMHFGFVAYYDILQWIVILLLYKTLNLKRRTKKSNVIF